MSSAKTATARVEGELQTSSQLSGCQPARRYPSSKIVIFPGRAHAAKRLAIRRASVPSPATPWTTAVRMDPLRRLIHDFRNTVQELVYAVERTDREAVAGLADSLDAYLLEALYGPKKVA